MAETQLTIPSEELSRTDLSTMRAILEPTIVEEAIGAKPHSIPPLEIKQPTIIQESMAAQRNKKQLRKSSLDRDSEASGSKRTVSIADAVVAKSRVTGESVPLRRHRSTAQRHFDSLSESLQGPRVVSFYGIIGVAILFLVSEEFASLVCNLVGFLLPAIKSVKAIESSDKDDDTEWLMYWVVFAVFSVFEFFSDIVLSWFPFYYFAKCVFLIWCMMPVSWNGSRYIYTKVVRPFVLKHEQQIDTTLNQVAQDAAHAIAETQESQGLVNRVAGKALVDQAAGIVASAIDEGAEAENKKDD